MGGTIVQLRMSDETIDMINAMGDDFNTTNRTHIIEQAVKLMFRLSQQQSVTITYPIGKVETLTFGKPEEK